MEMLIAVIVIVLLFIVTKNRKEKEDKSLDEVMKDFQETEEILSDSSVKSKPSAAKIKRRHLSSRRSRPVKNRRYRSHHGYDEGSDIEDVLLYLWLLDDFDWADYSDDNEWDVDGIDGISWVSFDGDTVTYYNDNDEAVFEVEQTDTGLTGNDLVETTLFYFVDSASDMITVSRDGEKETLSYVGDEWITPVADSEMEGSSLPDENVVEEVMDTVEDVAVAAAAVEVVSDAMDSSNDVEISVSSDNDSSSDSSVDSDTSY